MAKNNWIKKAAPDANKGAFKPKAAGEGTRDLAKGMSAVKRKLTYKSMGK